MALIGQTSYHSASCSIGWFFTVMTDSQARRARYDLHNHSTASDGELAPAALVAYAVASGVEVLALTDHDTTDGLAEARLAAGAAGIGFIDGVEISVNWQKYLVHIVGLRFDPEHSELQHGLARLRQLRVGRGEEMGRRLEKLGLAGALAGAQALANGGVLSRTHFARFLLDQGYVKTLQGAFDRYIGQGKPGYVGSEWATLEQAVAWITAAGGQAVIAHPGRYNMTATRLRSLIEEFKAVGGAAMEVVSGSQDSAHTRQMAELAQRYELFASRGTDYHGPSQTWLKMAALPVLPEGCVPIWSTWST